MASRKRVQPTISLSEAARLIGPAKLADRLNITPKTLRSWEKRGVPPTKGGLVQKVLVLFERAKKAAETRKIRKQEVLDESHLPKDFSNNVYMDVDQGALTKEQALPKILPPWFKKSQRPTPFRTENHTGIKQWRAVNKLVHELEIEPLIFEAQHIFERSTNGFCQVLFMFWRYVPFNPLYTGEIVAKQGTWIAKPWRTVYKYSTDGIRNGFMEVFDGKTQMVPHKKTGKLVPVSYPGAFEISETRFLFLAAMEVSTLSLIKPDAKPVKTRKRRT